MAFLSRGAGRRPSSVRPAGRREVIAGRTPGPAPHETVPGRRAASAGEHLVEALVALADADLHPAGHEGVAALEGVHQRGRGQPRAAVAEVLENELLQRHAVGHALAGEALRDQPRGTPLVEAATKAVLLAAPALQVAVGAAGAAVEVVDCHLQAPWAQPLDEQVRIGVSAEDLLRR